MSFKLKVTTRDGDVHFTTLEKFLAENEAAAGLCSEVAKLGIGDTVANDFVNVERVEPPITKRIAKFKVDWNFDRTRSASVLINRDTGMVEVRPHRRHKSHFMALADLAQIICTRSIAAEIRQKKKERKLRRMKGKAA